MIKELLQKLFGGKETSPAMTIPERETHQENNDMSNYTIFGRGNMATAIAGVLTNGGASVTHIGSEHSNDAKITGEVVILAVPYDAAVSIVTNRAADLAGKTVIDITNPLNFETFDSLVVPVGSSAAAEFQA